MLYTKIQPQSFLVLKNKISKGLLLYMGMVVILFNGVEPFEPIVNILSTGGPIWNWWKSVKHFYRRQPYKFYALT